MNPQESILPYLESQKHQSISQQLEINIKATANHHESTHKSTSKHVKLDDVFVVLTMQKTPKKLALSFVFARDAETIARTQKKDKKHRESDDLEMVK